MYFALYQTIIMIIIIRSISISSSSINKLIFQERFLLFFSKKGTLFNSFNWIILFQFILFL